MATTKAFLTIGGTVPADLAKEVRRIVALNKSRGVRDSLSAFIERALRTQVEKERVH